MEWKKVIVLKKVVIIVMLFCLFSMGIWVAQAKSEVFDLGLSDEKSQIQQTIENYFDTRYTARKTLQMDEIASIVGEFYRTENASFTEMDKIEIEFFNAEINHLRYLDYEVFLKFENIIINERSMTATVSVIEGHDVVFEATSPIVSSMRNLYHSINLQKFDQYWKIVSDDYQDDLWRMLNNTLASKVQIYNSIQGTEAQFTNAENHQDNIVLCSLAPDSTSHPYYREGAVNYAHAWAFGHNIKYYNFDNEGGDCTNFASQVIHEGGHAPMEFGGSHGIGTNGWYYYGVYDRAAAWNSVDRLHNFLVNEIDLWGRGPEGCEVDYSSLQIGDLVQFNWDNDEIWNHSVIVVDKVPGPFGPQYLIAAHTEDRDYYPLSEIDYYDVRYIHIERIDGGAVYLPSIIKGDNWTPQDPDFYPAPEDFSQVEQGVDEPASYPSP